MLPMPWICIGSMRICPTVKRGFSDAYGFWKMIWMRRLYGMNSRSATSTGGRGPRRSPRRLVASCSRISVRPTVVLPEPDSPTRPSVLPLRQLERHVLHRLELALAEEPFARIEALAEVLHVEHDRIAAG